MDNNENTNEVLTPREVARMLKCRTNQIYELSRRRGQKRSTKPLPVFTVHSRMKRVRKQDLMAWLDGLVEASRRERQGAR
jgi:hypothetical protein